MIHKCGPAKYRPARKCKGIIMSYVKTTWATGDVITAEKLNNMEGGIGAAEAFVIPVSFDDETSTMTIHASWNDIYANKNRLVLGVYEYESNDGTPVVQHLYLTNLSEYDGTYSATFIHFNGETNVKLESITFTASSADVNLTFED